MWRSQVMISLTLLSYQSMAMQKAPTPKNQTNQEAIVAEESETQIQKLQHLKKSLTEKVGICIAQVMIDLQVQGYDFMAQPHAHAQDCSDSIALSIEQKIAELLPKLNQHFNDLVESEKDLTLSAARLINKSDNLREAGKRTLALQNIATLQTALFEEFITLECYQELRNSKVIKGINEIAQRTMINNNP